MRDGLWTERTVAWYARADARSDYAAKVLTAAQTALAGCRSALDVGAGFGALALPLARRLPRVTALEPSPAMAAALRGAAARGGLGNVTVVESAWGQTALATHDLVVCAHVGPLLGPESAFLSALRAVARRAVSSCVRRPGATTSSTTPSSTRVSSGGRTGSVALAGMRRRWPRLPRLASPPW